jgi:hypothetical protein
MSTVPGEMTGTTVPATARRHPVLPATAVYGATAAVATATVAATAHAAGVPFEVDGEMIPVLGFAQLTVIGAILGGLTAATLNRTTVHARRWFVRIAVLLAALSCIPSIAFPPDFATKATLVATHLLAAAIMIPALARRIRD